MSNFCCNLRISHFVNCFNTNYMSTEAFSRELFFEFNFCLARTKYQNRFCIANMRNYIIVVSVEMFRKSSLLAIIWWNWLRFKWTAWTWIRCTLNMFFNIRFYYFYLFLFANKKYDNSLSMINPQSHFFSHISSFFYYVHLILKPCESNARLLRWLVRIRICSSYILWLSQLLANSIKSHEKHSFLSSQ